MIPQYNTILHTICIIIFYSSILMIYIVIFCTSILHDIHCKADPTPYFLPLTSLGCMSDRNIYLNIL